MLPYSVYPTIQLGPLTIHLWGVAVAIAFLTGLHFVLRDARKQHLSPDLIYDLAFIVIASSMVGGRILYVILNWKADNLNLIEAFKIWNGGLAFFGGFLAAVIAAAIYLRAKKLDFWVYADLVAPYIPLAHAIGRVGNILAGQQVGKLTSMPWGVFYQGAVRHHTAIYEMIGLLALFSIMMALRQRRHIRSQLFLAYLMMYSVLRFFIEFFRLDLTYIFGLTSAQIFCILLFIASGFLLGGSVKRALHPKGF